MSDERERIATPCPEVAPTVQPQAAPVPQNRPSEAEGEADRRERVVAALKRYEARPPKRPSWWGRR